MNDENQKNRKYYIFFLVGLIIAFLGFVLSNVALDTANINNVFVPVLNNTNLAPQFPGEPVGTGERISGNLYWANESPIWIMAFAHANAASETASATLFINKTMVEPNSGRPLGNAEESNKSVVGIIPKGANYSIVFSNYHHYEWREYPIISGKNGTLSVNQTFITQGSSFNSTYDATTSAFNSNYSVQTFPNSTISYVNNNFNNNYSSQSFPNLTSVKYTDNRYKLVTVTHDTSVTGDQAITGAGFAPKAATILAVVNGQKMQSWSFTDGTLTYVLAEDAATGNSYYGTTRLVSLVTSIASNIDSFATLKSMDADGMTITWGKDGLPTGTATLLIKFER